MNSDEEKGGGGGRLCSSEGIQLEGEQGMKGVGASIEEDVHEVLVVMEGAGGEAAEGGCRRWRWP